MKGKTLLLTLLILALAGCATAPTTYGVRDAFHVERPVSLLVVPVVNNSVEVEAGDAFLTTVSRPVAERGYYIYPVNLVKRVMEDDGLSDAALVHSAETTALASLFGADAVLYITIEKWTAEYALLTTRVVVDFAYVLRSGKTGELLWENREERTFVPDSSQSSGNVWADLIGAAITAAVVKAMPNYVPLAQQANAYAVGNAETGLPVGPYAQGK